MTKLLDDEIREEWEKVKCYVPGCHCETRFKQGYRAYYERHVQPPLKVVDLSKVAGPESIIPMLFNKGNIEGYLHRYKPGDSFPYKTKDDGYLNCTFDTTRPSVCFADECPLPEGVECKVWLRSDGAFSGPLPAHDHFWFPGAIYQVTGLLPNWVYPWEVVRGE